MGYMVPIIIVPAVLVAVVLIVMTSTRKSALVRIAALNADLHRHLLEKFGTADEALQYLRSDAGKTLLDTAAIERSNPLGRVLGSIQAGFLTFFAGGALLASERVVANGDAADSFHVLGLLGMLVGVGFLTSAAVSYVLIRRWGLAPAPPAKPASN